MLLGKLELFSISGLMILNLQRIVNMKICYRLTNNPLGDTHIFFFFYFAWYTSDLYLPCSQKKYLAVWQNAQSTKPTQKLLLWLQCYSTGAEQGRGWCSKERSLSKTKVPH